ncbi:tail completion protein gp17 [Stutzerimonas stutzeri]|uniref:tail completion protein gp17 n=1 Tax=Stutzerimonas stutzeri TaxID=316 RepID=UPI002108AB5E|nr:DUF3168 domain-containing protein [Stutzerimonas stutzeri]MCQ4257473.1 DUF3168 domain-containing protein [Stutzerimonas stutzeri]
MFLEESLYARLGPLAAGRVFPGVAPEGTARPYITYTIVSGSEGFTFGGPDGSEKAQVQVDVWAADHLQSLQLAKDTADELTREPAPGFGCSGVQRLPDDREGGVYGIRREFTLHPQE